MVFRILPHKFRAKAIPEGPSGNRALRRLPITSANRAGCHPEGAAWGTCPVQRPTPPA